ncbi:MAG: hypothetical protein HKO65_03600, partial [Gemmatimonadetes bacterium]|nr:hypothetical protein [Gemmatimonadota bacterium]
MRPDLTCERVADKGLVERYVSDTLPEDELEPFEAHLIECRMCQDEVVQAVAVREGLGALGEEGPGRESSTAEPMVQSRSRRKVTSPKVWVPVASAAVVAGLVFFGPDRVPEAISDLGRVGQPPIYLGVPVRQEAAAAESLFDTAMRSYMADEFFDAAVGLRQALDAGADPIPAQFFRGASLLMLDRPQEAAEAFGVIISLGRSPYVAEAHYYRAKSLLRLGDV